MFTQQGRLVFAKRGYRFRSVRWTSGIAATVTFFLLILIASTVPDAPKAPIAAGAPRSQPSPGGAGFSYPPEFWSDAAATRQRIDAEIAHNRVVLNQQTQDPSNGTFGQRILEFLDLTAKFHGYADQRWEEAIRRKDTRREAGYRLAEAGIDTSLSGMSEVIEYEKIPQ